MPANYKQDVERSNLVLSRESRRNANRQKLLAQGHRYCQGCKKLFPKEQLMVTSMGWCCQPCMVKAWGGANVLKEEEEKRNDEGDNSEEN